MLEHLGWACNDCVLLVMKCKVKLQHMCDNDSKHYSECKSNCNKCLEKGEVGRKMLVR